jgi:hypothetical protein
MASDRTTLAHANVTKARRIVAKQRDLIAQIRKHGGECAEDQKLLSTFETSLAIFEDDLATILRESACGGP